VYRGDENPIKSATIITDGLGIAPTIQLLKFALTDASTTIEDLEVLWMNELKSDFFLSDR
jgi:NAD(P)H-flavin reductase